MDKKGWKPTKGPKININYLALNKMTLFLEFKRAFLFFYVLNSIWMSFFYHYFFYPFFQIGQKEKNANQSLFNNKTSILFFNIN